MFYYAAHKNGLFGFVSLRLKFDELHKLRAKQSQITLLQIFKRFRSKYEENLVVPPPQQLEVFMHRH